MLQMLKQNTACQGGNSPGCPARVETTKDDLPEVETFWNVFLAMVTTYGLLQAAEQLGICFMLRKHLREICFGHGRVCAGNAGNKYVSWPGGNGLLMSAVVKQKPWARFSGGKTCGCSQLKQA
jgi:hypothetical protein